MQPEGADCIEAIIEAAKRPAIAISAPVIGRTDAGVPLAVELQIVAADALSPFRRGEAVAAPTHQKAVAGGRRIVDVVLHEVLTIIEQHYTVRFCRHDYSLIGRQVHSGSAARPLPRIMLHIIVAYVRVYKTIFCNIGAHGCSGFGGGRRGVAKLRSFATHVAKAEGREKRGTGVAYCGIAVVIRWYPETLSGSSTALGIG